MTTNRPEFKEHDDFIFEHKKIGKVTREEFIKYIRSSHDHMLKLSEIIQQYNQTIDGYLDEWDGKFESFDEDVKDLLHLWIQDGTMDHIINENLMSSKADKTYVDELHDTTTAQLAQTRKWVNVKNFGAKGDNETFDADAINSAITYARENNMNVYIPKGTYLLDKPVELKSEVSVIGENTIRTVLKKTTSTPTANGTNAVMVGRNCNNFELKGFSLRGDRTNYADGNIVTTDGLYLESCSYFKVEDVRVDMCKIGFVSRTNWCCVYERPVAMRCQSYGYNLRNSSTSHLVLQPTTWGCGGGFRISSCIYTTIINPVNDHSDAGGRPDDPFLPEGSGGNYLDPSEIFYVEGSSVAIISSGTEDSYSQYLYNEGSTVDLINPYIWKNMLNKNGAKFIQHRGTSKSITNITNPDFRNVETTTANSTRNYFYLEAPSRQKIKINTPLIPHSSFQEHAISNIDGVLFTDTEKIIDVTEHTVYDYMRIPFDYDESIFSVTPNEKKLEVRKIANVYGEIELLIPIKKGSYYIKQKNVTSSQYGVGKLDLIRKNSEGVEVVHDFIMNASSATGNTGGIFNITEDDYNLRIRLYHSTDVLDFETFIVEKIL